MLLPNSVNLRDRHVGDDVRIATLRVAGIDRGRRITIVRGICDRAVGVERSSVQDRIDFRERTAGRIGILGAVYVVTDYIG